MRVSTAVGIWAVSFGLVLGAGAARGEVLGRSTEPLSAEKVREAECLLGDLVADAARSAVNADLALVHASQLRPTVIPAGDLTRNALTAALPYPNEQVVLVTASGDQIWSALERGLSMLPKPSTAFLHVSGITVVFSSEAKPGERLDQVNIGREPLSRAKTYRTAMPASLAKGALGYFRIFKGLKVEVTGPSLGDALCDHVSDERVISPPKEQRLKDLSSGSE
ncbi:MAG: 5'-nucleotidase C-terminal domain-containing protein [Armatimonadota bacterium]|nr:MAG: 5'-nucleotidase C-terminal domain-containing protein [Armatimonadota bacterium]